MHIKAHHWITDFSKQAADDNDDSGTEAKPSKRSEQGAGTLSGLHVTCRELVA